jgi:hypothetical protein
MPLCDPGSCGSARHPAAADTSAAPIAGASGILIDHSIKQSADPAIGLQNNKIGRCG